MVPDEPSSSSHANTNSTPNAKMEISNHNTDTSMDVTEAASSSSAAAATAALIAAAAAAVGVKKEDEDVSGTLTKEEESLIEEDCSGNEEVFIGDGNGRENRDDIDLAGMLLG